MRYRAVHWSEGMFMMPQHFQAADRYLGELITTSDRFDQPYNYGLVSITVNEPALKNFQLEITGCQARLKDGSIISFDSQHVDRIDLKNGLASPEGLDQLFQTHEAITVYIGVPKLVDGRANISNANSPGQTRYLDFDLDTDDESAGGNRQLLNYRDLNLKVLLSTDERDGYDCIPICRLKRTSTGEGHPEIDKDYFPPCLGVDAWPELNIAVVRAIYDMIGERVNALSQQIQEQGINFASQHPGDLDKLLLTSELNQALGTLNCMAFGQGVHPFVVYTELCGLIGRLSIFGKGARAPEFPRYDHDNLAEIYKWAMRQIESLIYALQKDEYVQRYLVGAGRGMQVALEASWFSPEWDWFIGVDHGQISDSECLHLLASGRIDWKLGSSDQIDFLFQHRAEGVRLVPVKQVPRALPTRGNWLYFSISRDNDAWKQVELTNSLGMRVKEEQIQNLSTLQGQRKIIITVDGRLIGLEFAVFAVKRKL